MNYMKIQDEPQSKYERAAIFYVLEPFVLFRHHVIRGHVSKSSKIYNYIHRENSEFTQIQNLHSRTGRFYKINTKVKK